MLTERHPSARCPRCDRPLYYGLDEEPNCWKVVYECGPDGCGFERVAGRVPLDEVRSRDDLDHRAVAFGTSITL